MGPGRRLECGIDYPPVARPNQHSLEEPYVARGLIPALAPEAFGVANGPRRYSGRRFAGEV
jgi:hypothetical protein